MVKNTMKRKATEHSRAHTYVQSSSFTQKITEFIRVIWYKVCFLCLFCLYRYTGLLQAWLVFPLDLWMLIEPNERAIHCKRLLLWMKTNPASYPESGNLFQQNSAVLIHWNRHTDIMTQSVGPRCRCWFAGPCILTMVISTRRQHSLECCVHNSLFSTWARTKALDVRVKPAMATTTATHTHTQWRDVHSSHSLMWTKTNHF